MNKLKNVMNFRKDIHELRFYKTLKDNRFLGIKKCNYNYEGIGKHYCTLGLWWFEIECYNSLKS